MTFFGTILFSESSRAEQQIDSGALLREATAAKAAGNLDGAIESLRQFWLAEPFCTRHLKKHLVWFVSFCTRAIEG